MACMGSLSYACGGDSGCPSHSQSQLREEKLEEGRGRSGSLHLGFTIYPNGPDLQQGREEWWLRSMEINFHPIGPSPNHKGEYIEF